MAEISVPCPACGDPLKVKIALDVIPPGIRASVSDSDLTLAILEHEYSRRTYDNA
jgi:hypothetical protein